MDDLEYNAKLEELDHLLNDPDVMSEPGHIWSLLADISHHDLCQAQPAADPVPPTQH